MGIDEIKRKRQIQRKRPTQHKRQTPTKRKAQPRRQIKRTSSVKQDPEIQRRIDAIQSDFGRLHGRIELTGASEAIGRIEEGLAEVPVELTALERRGFLHSRGIRERLQAIDEQWQRSSRRIHTSLRGQRSRLRSNGSSTSRLMSRARRGRLADLSSAESAIEGLERKIEAAERELRSQYGNVDSELNGINSDLRRIAWMMDALEASPEIRLRNEEGPLMAVETEWHRDGDEGPEGVLFLTDQRLLFEQKEEIVTKKRFGLFKVESEMVHKLWLDINVADIASVEDSEEGGFLGMGKADILELTCSGQAPISRARFHLKGQDSSDWRGQVKRVQSGDVAAERHQQAREDGAAAKHTFPTQCPNCMAALPQPHRGATRVTCEFCGSVIGPN